MSARRGWFFPSVPWEVGQCQRSCEVGPTAFSLSRCDRDEPPHVHVTRENMVAKFWLDPVALQHAGGYNRTDLSNIAKLVYEHRELLLDRWHEFFGR